MFSLEDFKIAAQNAKCDVYSIFRPSILVSADLLTRRLKINAPLNKDEADFNVIVINVIY